MRVITIGRAPQNDIVINDPRVGRSHLQIIEHDNGRFSIVDLNSTNGTYVNGQRIRGEEILMLGDTVTLGNTELPWMEYLCLPDEQEMEAVEKKTSGLIWSVIAGILVLIIALAIHFLKPSNKYSDGGYIPAPGTSNLPGQREHAKAVFELPSTISFQECIN